ncbi:hypothetical protein OROHE_000297 [Orobanche hederae]
MMAIQRNGDVREKDENEYGDGVAWVRGPMLGEGSFGRVYKATLRNSSTSRYSCLPSEMAVKSAEVSVSGTLQKEKEIMNNLYGSPYVIQCFHEETTSGDNGVMAYNLLLEYGSGGTLADRIKKSGGNGLPEHEVRMHTRSILRGLNHIHGTGYVHCDLKPENILLVPNIFADKYRAKIGDFGSAKREMNRINTKKRKLMEQYCCWRGTPMYLSPKAVTDSVQEAPCDVWAVGCIVLEMITGKAPWEGKKEDILQKIGSGKELPKIPNEIISVEARDFLKHCFVRKSMFRFTCGMLLNHPFVQGLEDDVDEELSSDSFSCSSSSEEEYAHDDGGSISGLEEENESNKEIMSTQLVSSQCFCERQHHPVSFTIPAGI